MIALARTMAALLLDPAALLLLLALGVASYGWGYVVGSVRQAEACEAGALRQELKIAQAARASLEARLDTLTAAAAADAARAVEAAAADDANAKAVHATPDNPGACLGGDAARRLRHIR